MNGTRMKCFKPWLLPGEIGCRWQGWKILPEGWVGTAWDNPVPWEQWLLSMGNSKARDPSVMDELLHVQQVSLQEELAGAGQAWPLSLHRDRATVAAGQSWRRDQSHGLRLPRGAEKAQPTGAGLHEPCGSLPAQDTLGFCANCEFCAKCSCCGQGWVGLLD